MKKQILDILSKNSRIKTADIADMLDTTVEEVKASIQEMEDANVICGYPTLINWDNTDCEIVTALIEVKVAPQRGRGFDKIAQRIYQFEEVTSVFLMSGGFDLTVIIEGRSMKEVAQFVADKLATLDTVMSTSTHFVLKKYKEHGLVMNDGKHDDERMLIVP